MKTMKNTPSSAATSPAASTPDFPAMELAVLKFWQETDAFKKSVEMRPENKPYVFYDGPPFATGLPHYGHLLGSTSKDVIPRYWTMKGYRVERIWGWDCHGLPIENMIEKQLGIKGGKKGIEQLGVDKFNAACRAEVLRLDTEWEKIIDRLGRWVDFEHNYKTMDRSYMESVWWAFKQLYDKGLVYEGRKVILYCPRCATPLSNFEIAMDNSYLEVTEPSTTYKYPVVGQDKTFLLAWSTTPWNKIVTPALAVNPKLKYVKVQQGEESYILAESTLQLLKNEPAYTVVESYTGQQLTQLTFTPHYNFFTREHEERVGVVVADEFVTAEEGTGVVTLAVYGEDDYRVMRRENIMCVEHVDEEGKLKPEVTPWAGMDILAANPLVDAELAQRGLVYRTDAHQHSVATCYRCSTRLYYAPLPAWFINIEKLREKMIELNERINWVPSHLKHGRFQKGLENAPDWNISRSRYWGTPMPIWAAQVKDVKTGKTETVRRIIGSVEELKQWAVNPSPVEQLTDIHPEFLTDIEVWVDDAKTVKGKRISEVFDCWVESGSMPFAHKHYPFQNKEAFEKAFPGQFISEYIAQTRAWFYTMHVMSTGVFGRESFQNVLTTGTILAEDGSKMSKSKKNYPDPMVLIDKYGVDSLRLYLMSSTVMKSENLNFSEKEVAEIRKKVFLIWYNMVSFYQLYAGTQRVDLSAQPELTDVLDMWLVSRVHGLIDTVTKHMDAYDVVRASRALMEFVDELSTWYLRRSRERLRESQTSRLVFGQALVRLAQLFAPFTPFFTEWVYQTLVDPAASIHHTDWPVANQVLVRPELEAQMDSVRKVVERVHAVRKEASIKVRQPLALVTVSVPVKCPDEKLLSVLRDEVNVKQVRWEVDSKAELSVVLDTTLTPELEAEGEARELIRAIQKLRKTAGLGLDEHVDVSAPDWPEAWQKEIEEKTKSALQRGNTISIQK